MVTSVRFSSIVLAAASLALGFGLKAGLTPGGTGAYGVGAAMAVALGLAWLVAAWRRWPWSSAAGLALSAGLAGYGLFQHVGAGWMLLALVAALTAWDLDHFVRVLNRVGRVENPAVLERRHLQRLLLVDTLGLLMGAVALLLRTRLSLALSLILGLVVVLGLYRAISYLGRESG